MSTKSSPAKDDKATPSPSKKDEKTSSPTKKDDKASSSLILTRTQSTYLNTRQLRNKDSSRKKISEFTQQLLSPKKERNTKSSQSNKKKSPKEKKDKPKVKKQATVSVTKLVMESKREAKLAGKKHKIIAEPKVEQPAKRARLVYPGARARSAGARPLSAQELIDLCEQQSLDDDDFLEILTCESPVWWEETPADYEDEMFTAADEIQYFKEIYNQRIKVEPVTPGTADINIPTVKQQDDRFMKKRSKLENLLGNIKNKLIDTPSEVKNNVPYDIDEKMHTLKSNEASTSVADKLIKQEPEHHRRKSPSESTSSSSEDLFFGFQNDDVLKDFENMNIPIENMKKEKESKLEKDLNTKETIANIKPKDKVDTKDDINEDTTVTEDSFLETSKMSKMFRKKESLCADAVRSAQKCLPSNSNKNRNTSVSDAKNCQNSSKSTETNKFDSVKIYYIDSTSTDSNKKVQDIKVNINTSDSNMETQIPSFVLIKEESHTKTNSSTTNQGNNKKKTEINENKADACSSNDKSNTTKEKQEEMPNKSKTLIIDKDHLMAVYKIITDENYRESFKKTVTNEVEKVNSNSEELDTLLKDYSKSRSLMRPKYKKNFIVDLLNTDKTEPKNEEDTDKGIELNVIKMDTKEIITNNENETKNDERAKEICIKSPSKTDSETIQIQNDEELKDINSTNASQSDSKDSKKDTISGNRDNASTEGSLNITSNVKSAKYCLKCSSIFETETCSYCAKKSQVNQDKNSCQQPRKGNI